MSDHLILAAIKEGKTALAEVEKSINSLLRQLLAAPPLMQKVALQSQLEELRKHRQALLLQISEAEQVLKAAEATQVEVTWIPPAPEEVDPLQELREELKGYLQSPPLIKGPEPYDSTLRSALSTLEANHNALLRLRGEVDDLITNNERQITAIKQCLNLL